MEFTYGEPGFDHVTIPHQRWVADQRPDDRGAIGFGNWTTIDEARQNGELTAELATQWAAYLEANGCAYTDTNC